MFRVPNKRAKSEGGESCLSYTPQNTMDYGTLLCTASNTVGEQRKPCVFHIIMAGRDQPQELIDLDNLQTEDCYIIIQKGIFVYPIFR